VRANVLAKELKKAGFSGRIALRGFYGSAVGRMYRSRRFKFDVDDWSTSRASA